MQYNDALIQYDQSNVNYAGMWSITINETTSFSESFSSIIRTAFAELVSFIDTYPLYSRYDDSSLRYDEATAKYDHFVEADASSKKIGITVDEIFTITETISRAIGIAISETISLTESFYSSIRATISEVATMSESISKTIRATFSEIATISESIAKSIGTVFSETITMTESLARVIRTTISEAITLTELYGVTFRMTISEVVTMTEALTFNIYERLKGILGMIKEFVRVSDKKEKVSAINVLEGVREQLNVIERQYDESTLMYDESNVCYNNYISSEKPVFVLGKKSAQVSLSNQKDKPIISKR